MNVLSVVIVEHIYIFFYLKGFERYIKRYLAVFFTVFFLSNASTNGGVGDLEDIKPFLNGSLDIQVCQLTRNDRMVICTRKFFTIIIFMLVYFLVNFQGFIFSTKRVSCSIIFEHLWYHVYTYLVYFYVAIRNHNIIKKCHIQMNS